MEVIANYIGALSGFDLNKTAKQNDYNIQTITCWDSLNLCEFQLVQKLGTSLCSPQTTFNLNSIYCD